MVSCAPTDVVGRTGGSGAGARAKSHSGLNPVKYFRVHVARFSPAEPNRSRDARQGANPFLQVVVRGQQAGTLEAVVIGALIVVVVRACLLVPQGHERVEARGTHRGHQRGGEADEGKESAHRNVHRGIRRADSEDE